MKRILLYFGLFLQSASYGAAFAPDITIESLELEIGKAMRVGAPVAGIAENLERLAALYSAKDDVLHQFATLQKISNLKGLSKQQKKEINIRIDDMFRDLENRFKIQAGQMTDTRARYAAQVMLARLYLLRNKPADKLRAEPGDRARADAFLKIVADQQNDDPSITHEAYIFLGDLNAGSPNEESQVRAEDFYRRVPETDQALWRLAQAKLGIYLMQKGARVRSESEKERLLKEAMVALAKGAGGLAEALAESSLSFDERITATYLAAKGLESIHKREMAVKYFVEVANNSSSDAERFRSNMSIALILLLQESHAAPDYFKEVYKHEKPIKGIEWAKQMFTRLLAAKQLAIFDITQDQLSPDIIEHLTFIVTQTDKLVSFLEKNKRLLDKVPGVIRNYLILGYYSMAGIIDNAMEKSKGNEAVVAALSQIKSAVEKLDDRLGRLKEEKNLAL